MRIKPGSYFGIFLMLLGIATIIISLTTMQDWESMLLPIAMGAIIFLLSVLQLWTEVRKSDTPQITTVETQPGDKGIFRRRMAATFAWVIGTTLGFYLLGFLVGTALLMLSYLKIRGRSWGLTIIMAGATTVFIYVIFEIGLAVQLYRGFIYEVINRYLIS